MRADRDTPVVTTERLVLRGHRVDDFEDYAALRSDPEVVRYLGGKPSTPSESWSRILNSVGHWTLMGYGFWAIEERSSGRYVGEAGLADFKRDIEPGFEGAPEAGWVLAPWSHGRGYATEAARAVLAWGEKNIGMTRCVCMIEPEHGASLRVADKCGFRPFAETEFKGAPVILLERVSS